MMKITKPSAAGTLESSDCRITIRPNPEKGIKIDMESNVAAIFGHSIQNTIQKTLEEFDVQDACVEILDHGALDCVIRARMQCAIFRGAQVPFDWKKVK